MTNKNLPIGRALANYARTTSTIYDAVFDKQIRKAAPHWGWVKK